MIFVFILLFIGTVVIFGSAIQNNSTQDIDTLVEAHHAVLQQEEGVFSRSALAEKYAQMPEGNRTMDNYYDNRAYPGAPPMITHPLLSEKGIGGKTCLQCHQNGGYVAQFDAFAPVTPHADWINCKQCHVPMKDNSFFKNTDWEKPTPPERGVQALMTSPTVMPHGLANRENCLSCHAGPAAPKEIRVSHPERINCRQCHVPNDVEFDIDDPIFSRNASLMDNEYLKKEEGGMSASKQDGIRNWVDKEDSN